MGQLQKNLSEMIALWGVAATPTATASAVANTVSSLEVGRTTSYEALRRLSSAGLVTSTVDKVGNQAAVVYSVTPAGESALRSYQAKLGPFLDFLDPKKEDR